MRVMLSTIGSRGDVQPLVALASRLRALGQDVRVCVPPDFREWIESLGIPVTPVGPEVRKFAASRPADTQAQIPPSPEQRQQMGRATVAAQFEAVTAAARGCDIIVAATALQIAARSVAEKMGNFARKKLIDDFRHGEGFIRFHRNSTKVNQYEQLIQSFALVHGSF